MIIAKAFIDKLTKELPDLCTSKDLVNCGLYISEQAAHTARKKRQSPPFFRIEARGVVYCKVDVIDFVRSRAKAYENRNGNGSPMALKSNRIAQKQNFMSSSDGR